MLLLHKISKLTFRLMEAEEMSPMQEMLISPAVARLSSLNPQGHDWLIFGG
jgi:hypothetical protein